MTVELRNESKTSSEFDGSAIWDPAGLHLGHSQQPRTVRPAPVAPSSSEHGLKEHQLRSPPGGNSKGPNEEALGSSTCKQEAPPVLEAEAGAAGDRPGPPPPAPAEEAPRLIPAVPASWGPLGAVSDECLPPHKRQRRGKSSPDLPSAPAFSPPNSSSGQVSPDMLSLCELCGRSPQCSSLPGFCYNCWQEGHLRSENGYDGAR